MTQTDQLSDAKELVRYGYNNLNRVLSMMSGDEKHSEAATSTLDVIWTLYDQVLDVDPLNPDDPNRDRFYL